MISAKLIKNLEEKGFKLDFPSYDSKEGEIIEILSEENERLNLAIPLLLEEDFDYEKIINELRPKSLIHTFDKIIIITNKIFKLENIYNKHLEQIIKKNKIRLKIAKDEFIYYHDAFREFLKERKRSKEETLKEQIEIRSRLNINKAISILYSPGKQRIMNKIFNHEPLTNTELKYYYRSIRPLIQSILNENLQKYVRIIESTKKYTE